MEKHTNEEVEVNLVDLFRFIKSRLWIIILTGLIFASVAGLYSEFMLTPIYTSKTQLYILGNSTATSTASLADIQIGTQLTQDYMILVKSKPVANQVIKNLYLDMTTEEMADKVSVSNPNNTRILEIKVDYPSAYLAKRIVDEFALVATEQINKIMGIDKPTIIDEGNLPTYPSSPNILKNTILGCILGALLSGGIIVALYMMDDTIKDSDDVDKYLGLSTLGLIPIENSKEIKKNRKIKTKQAKVKIHKKGKS
jgi:capsular polysaccharide biosynthesis protein